MNQEVVIGKKLEVSEITKKKIPLCETCRKWNTGLITLHNYEPSIPSCSDWENSLSVFFGSKLRMHVGIQDERLFVVEQFVRQFQLYKKYK